VVPAEDRRVLPDRVVVRDPRDGPVMPVAASRAMVRRAITRSRFRRVRPVPGRMAPVRADLGMKVRAPVVHVMMARVMRGLVRLPLGATMPPVTRPRVMMVRVMMVRVMMVRVMMVRVMMVRAPARSRLVRRGAIMRLARRGRAHRNGCP
jgi:hypothetical protein